MVQGLRSSQSAAVAQGMHPSWATCSQTPFALQGSVVQGLRSSQSAAVVHGTQSAMVAYAQAPASQESVVQALPSSQSAAVVHALTVAACATSTASRLSIAARAHAPRADLVLLICPLPSLCVAELSRASRRRRSAPSCSRDMPRGRAARVGSQAARGARGPSHAPGPPIWAKRQWLPRRRPTMLRPVRWRRQQQAGGGMRLARSLRTASAQARRIHPTLGARSRGLAGAQEARSCKDALALPPFRPRSRRAGTPAHDCQRGDRSAIGTTTGLDPTGEPARRARRARRASG